MKHLETADAIALRDISALALQLVDNRYGQSPDSSPKPADFKSYHNGLHTRNVMQDFSVLATAHGLSPLLHAVGSAASAAHDLDQNLGSGSNESASGTWLQTQIERRTNPEHRYAQMGMLAVLGTEPVMDGFVMTGQKASQQDYRSADEELVAKLVASADLGRMYSADGPYTAHLLAREFAGEPEDDNVAYQKLLAFQRNQPAFLETYHYPLDSAARLLMRHEVAVKHYAEELIGKLEQGQVTSWQDVLERDVVFARNTLALD